MSLNIILEAGRALRWKVIDQAERPVAKATIDANLPGSILAQLGKTDTNGIANVQAPSAGTMTIQVEAHSYASAEVEPSTGQFDAGELVLRCATPLTQPVGAR